MLRKLPCLIFVGRTPSSAPEPWSGSATRGKRAGGRAGAPARLLAALLVFCAAAPAQTPAPDKQEGFLASEFRREGEDFGKDCKANGIKSVASCAQLLITGTPLHLTAGSIAAQNGVGFGPAFVLDYNTPSWRMNFNTDAVVSTNQSWRAGIYAKLAKTATKPDKVVILTHRPTHPLKPPEPPPAPELNFYAQGISLQQIPFYGIGNNSRRSDEALFGMREVITGANALVPIRNSGLGIFGELNGRFIDLRPRTGGPAPSIEQIFSAGAAPGLIRQPGFLQTGEGVRFGRTFAAHLTLDYSATYQQFVASDSTYSFQRLHLDFSHEIPIYGSTAAGARKPYGPDGRNPETGEQRPTYNVHNREGSVEFGVSLVESFLASNHVVPFYFQPTLGGSDLNGDRSLPSYADYRFRAPNLLLFHGSVEHSIWGPIGVEFLTQYGRVAATRSDLGLEHFRHSFAAGLTIHAGGLPQVSILFAWAGHEGTHTIAYISPFLLGGSNRPSLF